MAFMIIVTMSIDSKRETTWSMTDIRRVRTARAIHFRFGVPADG